MIDPSSSPLVSVVIAAYNMAAFLPEAIRSALDQTYANVEVLVIDDGSTDDTASAVQPLLSDSRLRYLPQQNRGQAAAKNVGVRQARGQFVAFLDADDSWFIGKLARQMPLFLASDKVGVVYGRVMFVDQAGTITRVDDGPLYRGRVTGPLFIDNFVGFGTAVVRRECFDRLGGFDEDIRMGIDYDLWLRFSTEYDFDYVDQPLLRYRIWDGQMSRNFKGRYQSGISIMNAFLRSHPGVIDGSTESEGWAHTYTGLGECMLRVDHSLPGAFRYYLRALRHQPVYIPAWKAMLKSPAVRVRDAARSRFQTRNRGAA